MASKVSGLIEKVQLVNGSTTTTQSIASTAYGYCETAAATAIKNVDMTGFKLEEGVTIHIKFANANSASNPKLKFNSEADTNAKPIVQYGTTAAGTTSATSGWYAGAVLTLTYDGTSWVRDQGFNTNDNNAVTQTGITTANDYPILLKNSANTTDETTNVNYSNNITSDVTATKPFTFNPSTGTLTVTQIKIGTKDDNQGLFPNLNNWNQIGSSSLYWYRAYINNYYGTTSHVTNWDAGKNIGTAATTNAAATKGSVNFYNTCAAGGTQTKTTLTADSTTNSNITLTLPSTTGTLALVGNSEHIHNYIGKDYYVAYPSDGIYNGSGTKTGYIKIKIPKTKTATMFSFDVDIYNYVNDTTTRYHIAGYNYTDASWNATTGYCASPITNVKANLTIRFLSNNDDQMYVCIGETDTTWSYPKVTIHNISINHSGASLDNWKTGWTIDLVNTAFTASEIKRTITNTNIAFKTSAANLTTTVNAVAYYTDTTGTFGTKASANGALYATSANGTLNWGTLPIAQGGTGATSAIDARTNLGLGTFATKSSLAWNEITQSGANNLSSGASDVTASTEILTSYASNNGFSDSGGKGIVYRRAASKVVNATLVKAALGTNSTHNNTFLRKDGTWEAPPYPVTSVASLTGAISASDLVTNLGLSKAMRFIGIATVAITDGSAIDPVISGYTFGTNGASAQAGDVIIDKDTAYEYVWTTSNKWERLGGDSSYKTVQTAVNSATAETSTATTFVHSVTQDANGVITVKTRPLPTYNNYSHPTGDGNLHVPATGTTNNGKVLKAGSTAGSISWGTLSASDVGAATSGHNHDTTYLKLDGSNRMTGDLGIVFGDTDKFVHFVYNASSLINNSWRTGVLGTGTGDANYFVIQSGGVNNSSNGTWNDALRIGQQTYDAGFSGNVYPITNNSKDLGTSSKKWANVYATEFVGNIKAGKIIPTIKKTYTDSNFYGTTDSEVTCCKFFISVKPDGWYKPWQIRFKVRSYCPGYTNVDSVTWCTLNGRADSLIYANWNERYDVGHYYITCRPLKNAGFNNGLGHAVGINIRYATGRGNSAYYRTIELDYYDCENCTVTVLDNAVLWENWTSGTDTNYNGFTNLDAVNRGLRESGDDNETGKLYSHGGYLTTGNFRIPPYTLMGYDRTGKLQGISLYNDGYTGSTVSTNTARVYNTNGFDYTRGIFWHNGGGNYAANTDYNATPAVFAYATDLRYTDNNIASTSANTLGMIPRKPVYFRGTIESDGLFYLAPISVTYSGATYKRAWTQDIPTSADNYVYWFIGYPYYDGSYAASLYRINLQAENPLYWYHNGRFEEYIQHAESADSVPLSGVTDAADLKAIEALTGTSGLLKKTAANTWTLDTSSYVTSSGVTSITIKTSSPLTGGSNTATTSTGTYTLGLDTSGTWSGTATTADKLTGFSSRSTTMTWGNQTGSVITCFATSGGGGWGFRDNNPASGQTSMTIDGTIYIKEGGVNISDAVKSFSVSGQTVTYTNLWGGTGTFTTQDTKNTAGSTDSTSKLYLIGATSQAANPQTYSDSHVFETNGAFSAKTVGINNDTDADKVTLQWNSTDLSLDFIFA